MSKLDNFFQTFKGIDKFLLIFIMLIPSSLIAGPFLPDFFIVILSIGFFYKAYKLNLKKFLFNKYGFFFILFWLYVSLRSFWADDLFFSLKASLPYIRFFIFSLIMLYFFKEYKEKFIYLLLFSVTLPIVFVFFDTLYQYLFGKDIFGYSKLEHRLSGPFGDELIVGSYLARLSPLLIICYYIIYKKIPLKVLYLFSMISPLIFLTGERTSFFLFNFNNKLRDRMIYIPACEMRINLLMTDECKKSLEKRKINEIENHKKTQKYFIFSEAHEGHYRTALNIFLDNKFFGVGAKMFRIKCSDPKYYYKHGCTTHPHNIVMQILAETGLIGLSFLIIAITYIYIKAFKIGALILRNEIKSFHIIQFLLLVMMAQSFLFFLPSGQFFNNWNAIIIYFPLGIYLKYVYKN